jgi:hypothetical protein
MVFLTHFDVAHEEADGEHTHEKLKASETAMQSRCTRQLESNGRTSPANEPWSGSWLDPSLGILLDLLLVSPMNAGGGEDGWRVCSKGQTVGSRSVGKARLKWRHSLVVRTAGRRCSF